jgi:hypothetical protein
MQDEDKGWYRHRTMQVWILYKHKYHGQMLNNPASYSRGLGLKSLRETGHLVDRGLPWSSSLSRGTRLVITFN